MSDTRYAYSIELTRAEYRDACYMCDRGYLGELTRHATAEDWTDDESAVVLRFTEPDAWKVNEVCEEDPHAVWSLTDTRTTLGAKFQSFLDSIV